MTMRFATTVSVLAAAMLLLPAVATVAAEQGGLRQQPLPPAQKSAQREPATQPQAPPVARPATPLSVTHRGTRYLVREGQWFEQRGADYVVVAPPAGVMVKDLPKGYAMRWIGGAPYFYADGLYYVWRQPQRSYEIVQLAPAKEAAPAGEQAPSP
jgi:hypothetical protein